MPRQQPMLVDRHTEYNGMQRHNFNLCYRSAAWLVALASALGGVTAAGRAQAQAPADRPLQDNVVIVLDASGSMSSAMPGTRESKMEVAKDALEQVLVNLPEGTNVGLLVFSAGNISDDWVYPLGPVDKEKLRQAIHLPQPRSNTPLGEYLKVGVDRLLEQREQQRGFGTYRLLVVTDGDASDPNLVERYVPDILSRGITVDVIGVNMRQDHMLATRVHSYRSANDPGALFTAVSDVLAEVGSRGDDTAQQEDFELLAALPDDMALPVIEALNESGNQPIGEGDFAASQPQPTGGNGGGGNGGGGVAGPAFALGLTCATMLPCVVVFIVIGIVFLKIIKSR